ncbi:tetratricopeptide repeat protein [Aridibaculum aurantiacum]|uniref:tetratricopeptide repeat protein n=1 Tax=Aridibaculum aurantiacum TaxID=2810307 RepID=UPI001A95AF1D|nr:tetratricopeptide repeat protein [Aridibaculum aurantiacum]
MRITLLLLFIVAITFIACQSSPVVTAGTSETETSIPALFERQGELAKAVEWPRTKEKVAELRQKIASDPTNIKPRLQIATIYITEARITGEHPYYYPAIDKILDDVIALDANSYEALVLKASVKLSQHKFKEALALANRAKAINPNEAYVYGILVDANVELGNYEEAINASDKMQALKPSLESYSRASYLREIFGDTEGAIDAMRLASQAGLPGSEPQCWSMKTLAELYVNANQLEKAEVEYQKILEMRPSYAFATAGLAKIEEKKKNYDKALQLLNEAAAVMPEYSFYEQMGDIYVLKGETGKAEASYAKVKEMLEEDAASGHLVDLDLAKLYVKMNKLDLAKKHVMNEYALRPNNIDVNKELAWIAFKENDLKRSKELIKVARRTGSKDPELVARAEMINGLRS